MRKALLAGLIALLGCSLLAWADGLTVPFNIPATACTNQFIRSIAVGTGVGTCATVGSSDLASSLALVTPNIGAATATSVNFGGSTLSTYTALTWTPAVSTDATPGTPAYTTQVGSYEQIGRQVTVRFSITLSGWTGSPSGNITITGLPLTSANTANDYGHCIISAYAVSTLGAGMGMTGLVAPNTTTILLRFNTATGTSVPTVTNAGTTPTLFGVCNYHT